MPDDATAVLRSPAKINLGLRITGVQDDGYHQLQSLFVPISLYDEVVVGGVDSDLEESHVTFFTENNTPLEFQNDTASHALQVLNEAGITHPPLEIKITKRIPWGSGLGGGSSNGATILKFIYERFAPVAADSHGSQEILRDLALKVGSDTPFFLGRGPAFVWGTGEKIKSVKLEPFAVLVCKPPFEVSTKQAYSWFDDESALTHRGANATNSKIDGALASGISGRNDRILEMREIIEIMQNDLERSVEARHPEIGVLKKALRQWGALGSLMSGSGSSVYGVFRSLSEATMAREKLQQNFPSTYAFFACEALV